MRILPVLNALLTLISVNYVSALSNRKIMSFTTSCNKPIISSGSSFKTVLNYNNFRRNDQKKYFSNSDYSDMFNQAAVVNGVFAGILALSKQNSLTTAGLIHSTALGLGLWSFLGIGGWLVGVIYFIIGSAVTKVKMKEKEKLGIAEKRGGARGPENVWGSAAAAMICAILTYFYPESTDALKVGFVAAFATKLSDTVASEIGKAYGKTTYLITSLKIVPRGTEGAVSIEGTVAGIIASVVIAVIALGLGVLTSPGGITACIIAAFVATTIESYIGATFQDDNEWLTNELVNLINTFIGAIVAIGIITLIN